MFLLIGDGADRDELVRQIEARGLSGVRLLGLRPRAEIPAWIASSDVLLVCLRDLPVFQTVIPSKLFEYWAQERPVVFAAPHGECREMIETANAGYAIDPEKPDALVATLEAIRRNPQDAAARARAGRETVMRDFVRDELARKMLRFVEANTAAQLSARLNSGARAHPVQVALGAFERHGARRSRRRSRTRPRSLPACTRGRRPRASPAGARPASRSSAPIR